VNNSPCILCPAQPTNHSTLALSRPIIQSGFRSSSPAYPLLHIDALNNALAKSTRVGDVDPVIYVPTYDGRDALFPSACCHILYGDIRIVCPVSGEGELWSLFVQAGAYWRKNRWCSGPAICVCFSAELRRDTARIFRDYLSRYTQRQFRRCISSESYNTFVYAIR
jgi:hypothetical protein